jgi:hypothetical protein
MLSSSSLNVWKSFQLINRDVANVLSGDAREASLCAGYVTVSLDAAVDDVSILLADATSVGPHCDGTGVVFCSAWYNVSQSWR